jgi:recombination protein RecA
MTYDDLRVKAKEIGFTIVNQPRTIERISTGIAYVDYILGGGYPRGRAVEIYGPAGTSKSTMAMLATRSAVLNGLHVAYFDVERTFSTEWADKLGLPVNLLDEDGRYLIDFPQPDHKKPSQEQWLALLLLYINAGLHDLVIADTFGAMASNALLNADITKGPQIGVAARNFTRFWQQAINPLHESNTALLIINQERVNIGDEYHPVTAPGGKAHEHSGSIRIETYLPKTEYVDKERTLVKEHEFRFYVRKTKVSETRGKLNSWFLIHDIEGDFYEVDQTAGFIELAKTAKLFDKQDGGVWEGKGNAYFHGVLLGNGEEKISESLKDPDLFEAVLAALKNPNAHREYSEDMNAEPIATDVDES